MDPEISRAENEASDPDGETVSVYLDATTKRLDIQFNSHVALDSKVGNILSVGSAILPVTFGLLGLSEADIPFIAALCLVLAGAAYGVLLVLSWLIVRRASGLATGAPIGVLSEHVESRNYPGDALRLWVAREYASSIRRNEQILFQQTKYVGRARYALYIESALLSIAGVVSLLFG